MQTKFSHLDDEEFLRLACDKARLSSPLIESLCQRLERQLHLPDPEELQEELDEANGQIVELKAQVTHHENVGSADSYDCPVCEAKLQVCLDGLALK